MTGPVEEFSGRLALQQRVLPHYRVRFVDRLAEACTRGLYVYAGPPHPGEAIQSADRVLRAEWTRAENRYLGPPRMKILRQPGVLGWLECTAPEALVLESNPRYLTNWQAADWMRARGGPVVGWGLGIASRPGIRGAIGMRVWRRWLSKLDAAICYSSSGAAEYIRAGFPAGRTFVALNSVVEAPEQAPERDAPYDRPVRILYVGRLQERKQLDLLFEAIRQAQLHASVRVVGDGPARERFERAARENGVQAEFVGRKVGIELQRQYAWSDLFVLPGTGGLAVQEAMAHALPVVVARGDGTQADLVTPENGWLVAPGEARALAEVLQQAVQEPDELLAMGKESFRIVQERANIGAMRSVFIRALNAVTSEG